MCSISGGTITLFYGGDVMIGLRDVSAADRAWKAWQSAAAAAASLPCLSSGRVDAWSR